MKQLYIITATRDPKWYRNLGYKTIDMYYQYYAEDKKDAKQQFKKDTIISSGMRILDIKQATNN